MHKTLKKSIIATLLSGLAMSANAAIFINEPIVKSYHGQPLVVEIPVQADAKDWDTLWGTVELSNGQMMETSWKKPFSPGNIGSIQVRTAHPVTDAVVDLKVRVESMTHQAVMYYPVLIDQVTPTVTAVKPVQVYQIAPVPKVENIPAPQQVQVQTQPQVQVQAQQQVQVQTQPQVQVQPKPQVQVQTQPQVQVQTQPQVQAQTQVQQPQAETASRKLVVKYGDSLYRIAKRTKSANMSVYDAMQWIYDTNRTKFGKSMDVIRAGVELTLPY